MEKTRILIHQNDEIIKQIDQAYLNEKSLILSKANNVIALFTEFDETYIELGSTTAKYNELLAVGPQSYIDAAISKIKAEFATAGITSPAVTDAVTAQTYEKGNAFLRAFNELLQYLDLRLILRLEYPGMTFALTDIKVVDGLAAIKNEIDLEGLKDSRARQYIDTETGYDLVAKAESLVNILNSINETLRSNGLYNITDLNGFGDFAEYVYPAQGSNAKLEVNLPGIHNYTCRIMNKV
ncbi:hypothetical protein H9X96_03160 [Pedobacter sp. N36a]|uniref:hypothetical protein n=1 Tax=Pedobacter sp. N36a TaxID=2767996 RepID=UPI001656CC22|nr:hypothetical protein [Pedobacter sp. N36a]MBC8984769.1 hypothetical protein [Pedobacter sp. N36a]